MSWKILCIGSINKSEFERYQWFLEVLWTFNHEEIRFLLDKLLRSQQASFVKSVAQIDLPRVIFSLLHWTSALLRPMETCSHHSSSFEYDRFIILPTPAPPTTNVHWRCALDSQQENYKQPAPHEVVSSPGLRNHFPSRVLATTELHLSQRAQVDSFLKIRHESKGDIPLSILGLPIMESHG